MAWWKKPAEREARHEPSRAKQRRFAREKARRERMLRLRPPGAKERFLAGCMAVGFAGALAFLAFLTYHCLTGD